MGDQPLVVDGVSGESATEVIVDPALRHPLEGFRQHWLGLRGRLLSPDAK